MLDIADLRRNPKAPQFGRFGGLQVRYGKSSRGGPPKRRTVLLVPEMDWIIGSLTHWIDEVRLLPHKGGRSPAATRATRSPPNTCGQGFAEYGITLREARHAALMPLAQDTPGPILTTSLGLHINTAIAWRDSIQGDFAEFVASRARASTPLRRGAQPPQNLSASRVSSRAG